MSTLLPGPVAAARAHRVDLLGDPDRPELAGLIGADPVVNAVLDARVAALPSLAPGRFGGQMLGVREASGRLVAAAFNGGNLLPVGGTQRAWIALGRHLAGRNRVCSSIVGPHDAVHVLWRELAGSWSPYRAMRGSQPMLVLDDLPGRTRIDGRVRAVRRDEGDAYLPAAAAMFTEELGVSPYACVNATDYRARVGRLIAEGRAFAIFGKDGRVVFKADLGAISARTCQVQGVWVRPDLRGRGIGTAALAGVLSHGLTLAPTVSLYVNDFNAAARRVYAKLGMRQVATLATILF